jgi:hypothetical protein
MRQAQPLKDMLQQSNPTYSHDVALIAATLDKYPNFTVDQDRFLYGTDPIN